MDKKLFVLALASAFMCGGLWGCNDDSGNDESSCDKDCSQIVGGREHSCFLISGNKECKPACMGDKEGKNDPVCWTHKSIPEPNQKSVVDFCVKDDKGNLYADLDQSTDSLCSAGCDSATGICKFEQDVDKSCSQAKIDECDSFAGGRIKECFVISGVEECMPPCMGDKEGLNDPVCYTQAAIATPLDYSLKDFCIKDDGGKLFADVTKTETSPCSAGCDESTGICKLSDPE